MKTKELQNLGLTYVVAFPLNAAEKGFDTAGEFGTWFSDTAHEAVPQSSFNPAMNQLIEAGILRHVHNNRGWMLQDGLSVEAAFAKLVALKPTLSSLSKIIKTAETAEIFDAETMKWVSAYLKLRRNQMPLSLDEVINTARKRQPTVLGISDSGYGWGTNFAHTIDRFLQVKGLSTGDGIMLPQELNWAMGFIGGPWNMVEFCTPQQSDSFIMAPNPVFCAILHPDVKAHNPGMYARYHEVEFQVLEARADILQLLVWSTWLRNLLIHSWAEIVDAAKDE